MTLSSRRIALALFCAGCAAQTVARADQRSSTFDRLTSVDLIEVGERTTLQGAIAELRPSFLRPNLRGEPPTVFVDGIMASSPTVLRDLMAADVAEVHFLRGFEATAQHGPVHTGTIIEVTLRKRAAPSRTTLR